ncbi:MAG: hypothetical protein V1827_03925 [Candidatus Micrarchaeota archaeon]
MAKPGLRFSDVLKAVILLGAATIFLLGIILVPMLMDLFSKHNPFQIPDESNATLMPEGMARYYSLKNLSCGTLSNDFLIEATDITQGNVSGLLAMNSDERDAALSIASGYDSVQTTRTYVRGDWLKKVVITPSGNQTIIWKEGRIYQCAPDCTMNLLGDAGWQAHLDALDEMRSSCRYFGKTPLPDSVDMALLLQFANTGRIEMNGFRCERFLIFGNKTYADSLLASNQSASLSDDQRALIWAISHLQGPIEECLDDGTGVLVYRSLVLDLTPVYRFEYSPDGGMSVSQQTDVTYYSTTVPESFFGLPG